MSNEFDEAFNAWVAQQRENYPSSGRYAQDPLGRLVKLDAMCECNEELKHPIYLIGGMTCLNCGKMISYTKQIKPEWKEQGLCPQCGEKGHFSHFQYVCKDHGPY